MIWRFDDATRVARGMLLLPLVALTAAATTACRGDSAAGTPQATARQVRVEAAVLGSMPRSITVSGTLAAEDQVALGMKVTGRLQDLTVDLGSAVKRGDELARLVPTDFRLRVQQAEAALQQARTRLGLSPTAEDGNLDPGQTPLVRQARALLDEATLTRERARNLFGENLLSQAELDAAEAAYLVAEGRYQDSLEEIANRQAILAQRRAELEIARQQLEDSVLRAPFDGAIREKHVSAGQFLSAGQPVLTLVKLHPLRLRLPIPERDAAGVRPGQDVRVTVVGDDAIHAGRVARLSPAIQENSRTLMVEAEVPNAAGRLRPGSFASAEIVTALDEQVVLVRPSAIITFAGLEKVIVVVGGKTVEKRVRTGRRDAERIEILEGIEPGESVVVEPGNLVGGESVVVAD